MVLIKWKYIYDLLTIRIEIQFEKKMILKTCENLRIFYILNSVGKYVPMYSFLILCQCINRIMDVVRT